MKENFTKDSLIKCPLCNNGSLYIVLDSPGMLECDNCGERLTIESVEKSEDCERLVKVENTWVKCPKSRTESQEVWWGKCCSCDYCGGTAGYSIFKCNYPNER